MLMYNVKDPGSVDKASQSTVLEEEIGTRGFQHELLIVIGLVKYLPPNLLILLCMDPL